MSKSLQDQLLALGVADKKKVRQVKHENEVAEVDTKSRSYASLARVSAMCACWVFQRKIEDFYRAAPRPHRDGTAAAPARERQLGPRGRPTQQEPFAHALGKKSLSEVWFRQFV